MNFKFLLVFFSAVMLVACGKPDTDLADVQPAVAPKASSTAIFLPGGGGIDFGITPAKENKGFSKITKRPTRSVMVYLDHNIEEVFQVTTEVLKKQGYKSHEKPHAKHQKHYIYAKDNKRISIAYNEVYREGFSKQTSVFFWYWDDQ